MSKYLSGIYGQTYSSGGTVPPNPTTPISNFVYGNQFIQGVIQLTADTKTSLQSTYATAGVYIGMDTANAYAGIKLLGPTSTANGSYIDFTTAGTAYKGRILYDNNANSMKFYTNATSSPVASINASGVTTLYGGISTDGTNSFTLPTAAGTNNYVLTSNGAGATTWASAVGGGGTTVPVSSGGTGVSSLTTNAVLLGNGTTAILSPTALTYSGSTLTLPKLISNDTTASTSSSIGSVLLSGSIGINNTTDATSPTSGGTFTTAGGGAFAGKLISGSSISAVSFGSGGNFAPTGNLHLRNAANPTINNFLIEAGTTSDGINVGWTALNFNGYNNGSEQRFNTGKNRWRFIMDQRASADLFSMDTYNGTVLTTIYSLTTSGVFTIPGTIASTSSNTGILVLGGGLGINNTTDATSSTNGGGLTCAGGGAFNKSLWVGTTLTAAGLTITNTGTVGAALRMLTPGLNTGTDIELRLGVQESAMNTGVIQFNYAGGGSGSNNVGIGFWNNNNIVQVYQSGLTVNGTLNVASLTLASLNISNSGTGNATLLNVFAGNLSANNNVQIALGVSGTNLNCGIIQFINYGNANLNNNLNFGLFNNTNMLAIYSSGVQINGMFNITYGPSTGTLVISKILANNLTTGSNVQMYIGVTNSDYNTGVIQFNYVGQNQTGSGGNYLGFGLRGSGTTNVLQVCSNTVKVNGEFIISIPGSASVAIAEWYAPSISPGNNVEIYFGVVGGTWYNAGVLQFNYVGSSGNGYTGFGGNNLGFGFLGANNIFQVFTTGCSINGELDINNSGSGTVTTAKFLAPNTTVGNDAELHLGIVEAGMKCAIIQFNYVDSGSGNGNWLGLGFYGNNNKLRVDAGGITVYGGITKSSGSFDIPHPCLIKEKQGYRIRHCFVESNSRGDNIYRYTVTTKDCKAEIILPDYFKHLNENPQLFITPVDTFCFYKGRVDSELEKVYIESSIDGTFSVLVIGTRKDKAAIDHFDQQYIKKE
jgi:hypothetical protein